MLVKGLSVLLFTFYLVADGPKMRRAICSRLRPERQRRVLGAWELAIDKTGGYLYSRALLAGLSAFFHWIVFQAIGIQAPVAMALWVGLISQFLPVVGTYIAGALPVLVEFVDSPPKALVILIFVILYQQIENYFLLAAHHRPDDGPAPGHRVRVGHRRRRRARCGRRDAWPFPPRRWPRR